ncbi:peptidoglycan-binding domain-containing protein [Aquimarina longa]|uniref:peptidoglycan-binding domain-containing protein n=1 Tax=Aquimarina longa TaxID=1080221 RepID=UPI0007804DFE|nr:peptidoglycan-binding domain-containing protein [Aquimarina longa]
MKAKTIIKPPSKNRVLKKPISKKPISKKKLLLYGIGGGLVLSLGYLAYTYYRNRAARNRSLQTPVSTLIPKGGATKAVVPRIPSNQFPLRRGSRGSLVEMVQKALIAKGGQAALIIKETSFRNGKPDGIFGKGTQRALRAVGYPTIVTQSSFTTLVGKAKIGNGFYPAAIAKELIDHANNRHLFGILKGLEKITSVAQYQQVSTFFQNVRILGTRVTSLVNALLSVAFRNKELEKIKIRAAFRKMGLQQNARGIWFTPTVGTIGYFEDPQDQIEQQWNLAITEKPTLLKAEDGSFIVPELLPNTVIGYITGIQSGVTRILTQSGETVFAPTQNVSYL